MHTKGENIFVSFLELLKVKHTKAFSSQYFGEHPYKYNLLGLSKMLSGYGIENAGTKIADKETDIFNIQTPFIAHLGGDFATVYKVELETVHYIWKGKDIAISVEQFLQTWTGIILLAETAPNSIEPDYKEHLKKELWGLVQKIALIPTLAFILAAAYISHSLFTGLGLNLLLLVNCMGAYISYLLVLKQLHIHSRYADKICSLFSRSDCNNVLETKASKLFGVFGWSEIGLGYFVANGCLLLFLTNAVSLLVLIKYLNAVYIEKGKIAAMQILNRWFAGGKIQKETFFKEMHLNMENAEVEAEFQKHEAWKEKTKLRATPAILFNSVK